MVEADDEAEGAPLRPSSSSAAIEKSGAKRAIKAKALIDLIKWMRSLNSVLSLKP